MLVFYRSKSKSKSKKQKRRLPKLRKQRRNIPTLTLTPPPTTPQPHPLTHSHPHPLTPATKTNNIDNYQEKALSIPKEQANIIWYMSFLCLVSFIYACYKKLYFLSS